MSINHFGLDRAVAIELTSIAKGYVARGRDLVRCSLAESGARELQQSNKTTADYRTRQHQSATVHSLYLEWQNSQTGDSVRALTRIKVSGDLTIRLRALYDDGEDAWISNSMNR